MLTDVCRQLGIQKLSTTVHRPNANGRCERTHKTLAASLAKVVATNQKDWDKRLPMVVFAMNCAKNATTGYSPFELMYGRAPRMPVDIMLDLPEGVGPSDLDEYAGQMESRLRDAYNVVRSNAGVAFARMKRYYDAAVKGTDFQPGQYVLFYYPRRRQGKSLKLSRLNVGPYRVVKRLNAVNYIIMLTPRSKPLIAHVDKLKLWTGSEPECWKDSRPDDDVSNSSSPPAADGTDDSSQPPSEEVPGELEDVEDSTSVVGTADAPNGDREGVTPSPSSRPASPQGRKNSRPLQRRRTVQGWTPWRKVPTGRPNREIRRPVRYRD